MVARPGNLGLLRLFLEFTSLAGREDSMRRIVTGRNYIMGSVDRRIVKPVDDRGRHVIRVPTGVVDRLQFLVTGVTSCGGSPLEGGKR